MRDDIVLDRIDNSQGTTSKALWERPTLRQFEASDAEGSGGASMDSPITTS